MAKNKYQQKADQVFENYPTAKEVFVTSDAQGFLNENRAKLHAKYLKNNAIKTFKKELTDQDDGDEKQKGLSVKELEEFARDSSDIPALEAMLEKENAKGEKARKTAISALETRIKTLKEQA